VVENSVVIDKRLGPALVALFAFQFLHGLAPAPDGAAEDGSLTGLIGGAGFLLATGLAWFWVRRSDDRGRRLARFVGVAIPVGFVLYHAAWFTSPVTNPYWGDGSATVWQWLSLPAVMITGVLAAALAEPARSTKAVVA
jgi:hypothetical protein